MCGCESLFAVAWLHSIPKGLQKKMDEPGADVEECVPVIQAQKRLDEPYPSHLEVAVDKDKLKRQEMETNLLHQQLKGADEEQKKAVLKAREQKETLTIFKQKYTAAIEKVHKVQGQVEFLEEELRYSQKKLKESQLETHSVQEELAELERRYGEKVSHWESSQEALDQLTDELQAYQSELGESQREKDHFKIMMGSLQEQMDTLKQQVRTNMHRTLAKDDLEKSLAASHQTHLSSRRKLEQEVTRLKQEVSSLELKLAGTQKLHVMLLRRAEEQLKEAKQESAMRSKEVDVQRGESQRLVGLLQKQEEKMKTAAGEMKSLRTFDWQLRQELDELHSKHQEAVEELAARAEEARRMEGCPNERKLAEEKIRSAAVRLEKELSEIRENLQQAVDQKLTAERDKQDAQERVNILSQFP
ncbi:unnamed protein product [Menidia menidia]|uniref:(Atlantic silverside) hypothetical protein n=1 Tax=Menidia menidia TaxID=238744 RepID=A0A8S4AP56_9TELE|nr:unnamed protein product [Menidia menidia]